MFDKTIHFKPQPFVAQTTSYKILETPASLKACRPTNEVHHSSSNLHFTEAISLNPRSAAAYYNLGASHFSNGNQNGTARAFRKVLELEPGHPQAPFGILPGDGSWSTAEAQESFAGVRVVRGYAREEERSQRFAEDSGTNRDNQIALSKWRGLQSAVIHAANDLCFAVILVVGGYAMLDGQLSKGDLFMFIDLVIKAFWPIIALGWMAGIYPRAVASAKRVGELLLEV